MSDYHDDSAVQKVSARADKTVTAEDAAHLARLERKIVTRLDLLLVPSMALLYLLAFLDRTNVGAARVAGLQSDLKISDHEYQTGVYELGSKIKNKSLTSGSAHGDLRTVHSCGTSFELDPGPDRASHSASHNLHSMGTSVVASVASAQLRWPTRMPFLPRACRGWIVSRNRSLSIRYVVGNAG